MECRRITSMYCVLILCMYLFPFKLCTFIEINSEVFAAALEQNLLAAENKVPFLMHILQIYNIHL